MTFRGRFLTGCAITAFLLWLLMGFPPLVNADVLRHNALYMVAAFFSMVILGLGGLIASAWCVFTYLGIATSSYRPGIYAATADLQEDRMPAVPFLAPIALMWLSGMSYGMWLRLGDPFQGNQVLVVILMILSAGCFLVVAYGTLMEFIRPGRTVARS